MSNEQALSAEAMEAAATEEQEFESVRENYRTPGKNLSKGDVVQGEFLKSYTGKYGLNYTLRTATGVETLNGCGSLDKQLETAAPRAGDILRITYGGKETIKNGPMAGKDAHQYAVQIKRIPR